MFITHLFTDFQIFTYWVIIAVFSICLHELFHAVAAWWQGDSTARDAGYFTLNPLTHMGGASLVMLLLTGVCWGACPVNPQNLRHSYSNALVSFAGPFANLLLMLLFALGNALLQAIGPAFLDIQIRLSLSSFFMLGSLSNAAFFILNMIPVPPLDGHHIFGFFIPKLRPFFATIQNGGFAVLLFLFYLPFGFDKAFWGLARTLSGKCSDLFLHWLA